MFTVCGKKVDIEDHIQFLNIILTNWLYCYIMKT